MSSSVTIRPLLGCPDVKNGDNLAEILLKCLKRNDISLKDQDIICVAQKVVSKAEGCLIDLKKVEPSARALFYSKKLNKDARKIELILQESTRIVKYFKHDDRTEGTLICKHKLGFISANAGVDESNIEGEDVALVLPKDPDSSAEAIRAYLKQRCGVKIGIVITDTFGRPWRVGQVNVAIGLAGVPATVKERGKFDAYGRVLSVTEPAFCDEISAASGLVVSKRQKTPFVLFRGVDWSEGNHTAFDIIRETKEDMFL
ncbi:MAG: coenzyme F420-0:L-glutamate ligase [Pseudomonadota bacterium]|nr:coenzyme F420-0:L-glutamate ligase [Pseudomonadota bacterium]